jgi:tetratricopeptide (TPR) repeat protein
MLAPLNQNADWSLPVTRSIDANSALSVLLIAALTATLLMLRRIMPLVTFFGLWWFVALAPEALIMPITDIAVEYRMYIPSIGFIAATAILASRFIKNKTALKASLIVLVLLFGILTITRNEVWATQKTFWADVAKKSPGSSRAHANYGYALYVEGKYREAVAELNRAISLDPLNNNQVYALNSLGLCYVRLGLEGEAEAEFKKALMLEQGVEEPYINLSVLYHQQGRYAEEADVLRMLLNAVPGSVSGRRNLTAVENMLRSGKVGSH